VQCLSCLLYIQAIDGDARAFKQDECVWKRWEGSQQCAHKGWGWMGIELNSQQTLTMSSCNLGTKSSLGLNCYFTVVYITTKLTLGVALLVSPMLLAILHIYTCIPSISTLPSLLYHYSSVRGTHKAERKVRGFQEWQPAFARSHICTVGNPDATKHSEMYQESVRNM